MKEKYISFPLSNKCLAITTTTELGNLAYQVDGGKGVKERRLLLADLLNINENRFVFVHQHHSDKIRKVTINDLGKGTDSFENGVDVDALYTYEKNVPLGIFHADCVPIFFIDETTNLVGIIHAGFKGTLIHVAYKSIQQVIKDENFYPCCEAYSDSFVTDEETKQKIIDAGFEEALINNRFDNGLANIIDLHKLGIKDEQISLSNLDTYSDDRFYSAHQKTPVGRLVSLIILK